SKGPIGPSIGLASGPFESPGLGITERASEGPKKARKACFRRKFDSSLRQRVPFVDKTRPAARGPRRTSIVSWAELWRAGSSELSTEPKLLALAKKAVHAMIRPSESARREDGGVSEDTRRAAATSKVRRSSPGGLAEERDTRQHCKAVAGARHLDCGGASKHGQRRRAAAASGPKDRRSSRRGRSPRSLRRKTRGVLQQRWQERACDGLYPPRRQEQDTRRGGRRPPRRPPPASGGRRRGPPPRSEPGPPRPRTSSGPVRRRQEGRYDGTDAATLPARGLRTGEEGTPAPAQP
ncbi:hypothetical protein THAOC_30846, partial [Thalassiosira oceanica]